MIVNGLYKLKSNYYDDFPHENHIHIDALEIRKRLIGASEIAVEK